MGVCNASLMSNIGLSCFYAQQLDLSMGCMARAIDLADEDEIAADVWYNNAHIALVGYCRLL